jgi:hypothetical protein
MRWVKKLLPPDKEKEEVAAMVTAELAQQMPLQSGAANAEVASGDTEGAEDKTIFAMQKRIVKCITFSGQTQSIRNPATVFSNKGPTPSKVAVVTFYLSVIFCVIGSIIVVRSFFLNNVSKVSQNIQSALQPT